MEVITMEVTTCSSCSIEKKQPFESLPSTDEEKIGRDKKNDSTANNFVNHAAIAWHENRRKWTGEKPRHSQEPIKEHIISWSATYEDLLSTNEPFTEPIPLQEMVDFLVDIWHDEASSIRAFSYQVLTHLPGVFTPQETLYIFPSIFVSNAWRRSIG